MPDEKQEKLEPCPFPACGGEVKPVKDACCIPGPQVLCMDCDYEAPSPAAHNRLARAARERDALRKELCEEKEVALGLGRDLERETQRADKAETALRERGDDLDRQSKIVDDLRRERDERRQSLANEIRGCLQSRGAQWLPGDPADLICAVGKALDEANRLADEVHAALVDAGIDMGDGENPQDIQTAIGLLAAERDEARQCWEKLGLDLARALDREEALKARDERAEALLGEVSEAAEALPWVEDAGLGGALRFTGAGEHGTCIFVCALPEVTTLRERLDKLIDPPPEGGASDA